MSRSNVPSHLAPVGSPRRGPRQVRAALSAVLLTVGLAVVPAAPAAAVPWHQMGQDIKAAAHDTGHAIVTGVHAAGHAIRGAAHAVGRAVHRAVHGGAPSGPAAPPAAPSQQGWH